MSYYVGFSVYQDPESTSSHYVDVTAGMDPVVVQGLISSSQLSGQVGINPAVGKRRKNSVRCRGRMGRKCR